MRDRRPEEYDHRDRPQKRIPMHERLRFPQEQSARQSRGEELDEPSYRREYIPNQTHSGAWGFDKIPEKKSAASQADRVA
jgi:hypothetical protein